MLLNKIISEYLFCIIVFLFIFLSLPPTALCLLFFYDLILSPHPYLVLFLLFPFCAPGKDHLLIASGAVSQTRHDCCNQWENTRGSRKHTQADSWRHSMWEVFLKSISSCSHGVLHKDLDLIDVMIRVLWGWLQIWKKVMSQPNHFKASHQDTTLYLSFSVCLRSVFSVLFAAQQELAWDTDCLWGLVLHRSFLVFLVSSRWASI